MSREIHRRLSRLETASSEWSRVRYAVSDRPMLDDGTIAEGADRELTEAEWLEMHCDDPPHH